MRTARAQAGRRKQAQARQAGGQASMAVPIQGHAPAVLRRSPAPGAVHASLHLPRCRSNMHRRSAGGQGGGPSSATRRRRPPATSAAPGSAAGRAAAAPLAGAPCPLSEGRPRPRRWRAARRPAQARRPRVRRPCPRSGGRRPGCPCGPRSWAARPSPPCPSWGPGARAPEARRRPRRPRTRAPPATPAALPASGPWALAVPWTRRANQASWAHWRRPRQRPWAAVPARRRRSRSPRRAAAASARSAHAKRAPRWRTLCQWSRRGRRAARAATARDGSRSPAAARCLCGSPEVPAAGRCGTWTSAWRPRR
mmetsp:Transcript_53434/g.165642  ORF Transcript_53434/g.165642 Transcript_53434/m.165642 type:complete len:310 (+) Transcript_53434:26-955(+)